VGRVHNRVPIQLFVVLNGFESQVLHICRAVGFEVRVASALVDTVANLFAADAPNVLKHPFPFCRVVALVVLVFVVILILVFRVLAARLIFAPFTTAPPHLATPVGLVHATAPVEVLLLTKLLHAVFARLLAAVEVALLRKQLLNPHFELPNFIVRHFDLPLRLLVGILKNGVLFKNLLASGFKPVDFLFVLRYLDLPSFD
jgi:hypothetical protein